MQSLKLAPFISIITRVIKSSRRLVKWGPYRKTSVANNRIFNDTFKIIKAQERHSFQCLIVLDCSLILENIRVKNLNFLFLISGCNDTSPQGYQGASPSCNTASSFPSRLSTSGLQSSLLLVFNLQSLLVFNLPSLLVFNLPSLLVLNLPCLNFLNIYDKQWPWSVKIILIFILQNMVTFEFRRLIS